MIHTIQKALVSDALRRLRSRKTHPLFAGYLHLQRLSAQRARQSRLQPDFVGFYNRFFLVKDHPLGTPYIKPFTNRTANEANLWLNENIAGTYAPSSLRPGKPFRQVVEVTKDRRYSLLPNHPQLALKYLLYGTPLNVADLAMFLYRDFGFTEELQSIDQLIACFAADFGYARSLGSPPTRDFATLFDVESANAQRATWLEEHSSDATNADSSATIRGVRIPLTRDPVRHLTADDLLSKPAQLTNSGPPVVELTVEGLLSFGEPTTFTFGRLNLLVGANGSGKSNLIDCLRVFQQAPLDIQSQFRRDRFEAWLYNGRSKDSGRAELRIVARTSADSDSIRHQLRLGPVSPSSGVYLEEVIDAPSTHRQGEAPYFVGSYRSPAVLSVCLPHRKRRRELRFPEGQYNPFQSILSQVRDIGQYPELTRLGTFYGSFRIYSDWSFGRRSELRLPSSPTRSDPQLSEQMNDLPATLNALEHTAAHERIKKLLPELKPTYRDFVTRIVWGQVGLELDEEPFESRVPAGRLSDGTLRFLALASVLVRADPPPVICIEEPELGMHPDMIRLVADMLVEASAKSQLFVTTHSEHLLTALQDDFDVLFAFESGPSGTAVRALSRTDFHQWRADHALGDLWSSGEVGGVRY